MGDINLIDINDFIRRLVANNITPEDLVARTLRNLYSFKCSYIVERRIALRNNIRACIAYVKLLYDFGQHMSLAHAYLLHRVKLQEVREHDLYMENSTLRGVTLPLTEAISNNVSLGPKKAGRAIRIVIKS